MFTKLGLGEWLDLCPLLEPLRALPVFVEVRRLVLSRLDAIWPT